MNWLYNLNGESALGGVSEDCLQYVVESYYLIRAYQTDEKQEEE